MSGFMGGIGDKHEPIALVVGVLGTIIGVLFFMQKFNFIILSFEITDITYMYFFAGFSTLASIILLFMTLGFLHVNK
jgi:hypothetical protein